MLLWHGILTAKSSEDRNQKIRQLGVRVERSQTKEGLVVEFIAGGKTRIRWVLGEKRAVPVDGPSGPSAEFDEECHDGEPPCLTDLEMEILAIQAAGALAEVEAMEQSVMAEWNAYCANNWWACEGDDAVTSGPWSEVPGCGFKTTMAVWGTAQAAFTIGTIQGSISAAALSGLKLTVLGGFVMYGAMAAAAAGAGLLVYDAIQCYREAGSPESVATAYLPFESVVPYCIA